MNSWKRWKKSTPVTNCLPTKDTPQQNIESLLKNWALHPFIEKASAELKNLFNQPDGYKRGKWGEDIVATLLTSHGFKLIQKNQKTPYGEIDLVLKKEKTLFIIEVKTRGTDNAFAKKPISTKQNARLKNAATWLWQQNATDFEQTKCLLAIVTRSGIKWRNLSLLYDRN